MMILSWGRPDDAQGRMADSSRDGRHPSLMDCLCHQSIDDGRAANDDEARFAGGSRWQS
jgi:hypothetical protein